MIFDSVNSIYVCLLYLYHYSLKMGSACCCQTTKIWEKELEILYKNDVKTGSLVKLTSQQKEQVWLIIKDKQYSMTEADVIDHPFWDKTKIGFLYLPGKYLYEGPLQNKKMIGQGRIIFSDRQIIYEGGFSDNKIDGEGLMSSISQGLTIKGRWKNGYPVSIKLESADEEHEIKFKQNCLNDGTISFADGRKYIGKFIFNIDQIESGIEGDGKLIYKNGDYLEGSFKNGFLVGTGKFQAKKKGYVYQGQFKDGLFQGEGIFFFSKTQFLKINWTKNKPHGTGTFTKKNQTYIVNYNQGIRSYLTNVTQ